MKTLVISISVLLIVSFSIIPAFGQTEEQSAQPKEAPMKEPEIKKTTDANKVTATAADKSKAADVNEIADPNAVRTEIAKYSGLDKALEKINKKSNDEIKEWTKGKLDERLDLVLAVRKQIAEEFNFLKELAVKEGAVKTAAAIDGILLDRQERLKDVTEELEKESRRFRVREEKRRELQERSGGRRESPDRTRREPRTRDRD
ncbi:MAG: hypothetical protein PHQ35_07810 [Phycisphaerae bacterium]|nr:hypothetical protein [Phycisphaerae bacterium]MDD5380067.1 hypothetical protein [Phycisphaerae bacterium]